MESTRFWEVESGWWVFLDDLLTLVILEHFVI